MADFSKYYPQLLIHEGGYVDHPDDRGKATNIGVTLEVWIKEGYDKDGDGDIDKEDLKKINSKDAEKIAKKLYWDKIKGDDINSQSVAELLFDFAYNSGVSKSSKAIQELVKVKQDGVIGNQTIAAINSQNPEELFNRLKQYRRSYYDAIIRNNPSQKVFLRGWYNRLNSFKFNQ